MPLNVQFSKIMIQERTTLNAAQLSMLRLIGNLKTVEEANELNKVICEFYARRVDEEMDKLWEEGKWSNEKIEAVLKEDLHKKA